MRVQPGQGIHPLLLVFMQSSLSGHDWITLRLEGPLQPKERPRQGRGKNGKSRSFTSPKYREWLESAQAALTEQWGGRPPLEHALVGIELHGHGRSDVDNLSGAVLDAAVKAGVLVDDRCARLPGALIWWQPAPTDQQQTFLYLLPWQPPQKK
jgi:Holliday junction resolvase RusA-like endonuclease